jgi:hypothetical protein
LKSNRRSAAGSIPDMRLVAATKMPGYCSICWSSSLTWVRSQLWRALASVAEEAVDLVEQQQAVGGVAVAKEPCEVLLGLADVGGDEIGGAARDQLAIERLGEDLGEGGLAGAGRAVEAEAGVAGAIECLDDGARGDAAGEVEEGDVEGDAGAAPRRGRGAVQEAAHRGEAVAHGRLGGGLRAQVEQAAGGAQLCRGQGGIVRQRVEQGRRQAAVAEVGLGDASAHRARRGGAGERQQEAAQEGRIHPLGAVGDPDRRDRVVLQGAVHPALLVSRTGATAQQGEEVVVGLEDVLDLVEDQQGIATPGEQALGEQIGREPPLRESPSPSSSALRT